MGSVFTGWVLVFVDALAVVALCGACTVVQTLRSQRGQLERTTRVLEAVTDFVALITPTGRVLYVNPAGKRLIGLPSADVQSDTWLIDFAPPWAQDILVQQALPSARSLPRPRSR